mmetsp:Transcript_5384/g.7510  ORF Transcript_5384/g.7510 Transcript_5384/m.7510 type:complete len:84 (-) Transcript_5384:39-290(-)
MLRWRATIIARCQNKCDKQIQPLHPALHAGQLPWLAMEPHLKVEKNSLSLDSRGPLANLRPSIANDHSRKDGCDPLDKHTIQG